MTAPEIFIWLAETTLAVSILIVLVLLVRKPFSRIVGAQYAYILWLAPFARLFLPDFNVLPAQEITPAEIILLSELNPASAAIPTSANISLQPMGILAAAGVLIWITGAFAWLAIRIEDQSRIIKQKFKKSMPAPHEIALLTANTARRLSLRMPSQIRLCDDEFGPAVIGIFRPILFLPSSFSKTYTANEQHLALAHELSHITRGDMFAQMAAFIFQALQWPNPTVHYAMTAFRADQEAACDAYVIARSKSKNRDASDYASAIIKSVRTPQTATIGLTLGHPLKERIMLIKNSRQTPSRSIAGGVGAAALIVASLAATASYGRTADDGTQEDQSKEVVKEKRVIVLADGDPSIDVMKLLETEVDIAFIGDDFNEEHRIIKLQTGDGPHAFHSRDCKSIGEDNEPVVLEWKSEEGDTENKFVSHTIICLTGDDADPEQRAEALRKAISRMEENNKKEEERRKKMLESLRAQLKELEQKD